MQMVVWVGKTMTPEERRQSVGGTAFLGDSRPQDESIRYWQSRSPDERIQAILDIRDFYYEVMKPGTGAPRLDRSVGGTRSLRG
jgi:hypothetical protein